MSNKEDSGKNKPSRPSIKISLPIELYYRRMRKLQEEAYEDYIASKEKEKNTEEQNSEISSNGSPNQTDISQEQKHSAIDDEPSMKQTPAHSGIPDGSINAPQPVQHHNYQWLKNRPHPYRHQRQAARVRRFIDENNNVTDQIQQRPDHSGNWQLLSFTTHVPTTE